MISQPKWVLEIDKIRCEAIIGVFENERLSPQVIEISAKLFFSNEIDDNYSSAICYDTVASQIKDFAERSQFLLIESLADALAQKLITGLSINRISITVKKFYKIAGGAYPKITVEREKT